jgi:hypothetical protein
MLLKSELYFGNGCPQEVDCSRSEAELKVRLITENVEASWNRCNTHRK